MADTFLLEIGTEEIPARFMKPALTQLRENARGEFSAQRISFGEIHTFGTPRRLTLYVEGLASRQQDLAEKKKGPAAKAAFGPDGTPTGAATGFARSQGVAVEELVVEQADGNDYVFALRREAGKETVSILPGLCERLVRAISFPKPMFWYSKDIRFARPIRWLTALYGSEVIPFDFAGLTADRKTWGHRFLAPGPGILQHANDYRHVMAAHFVTTDLSERRETIIRQVKEAAAGLGGHTLLDEDLLEEVVNLVEYPKAVVGGFSPDYLQIPPEVLITAMRAHQRYFPVFAENGKLLPHFIAISNGTNDEYLDNVRSGNERVLRARLADARFFFEEDRKKPLAAYADMLDNIVFMEPLGTMRRKTERVVSLTGALCRELNLAETVKETAVRAAALAKADLMTHMVYEFPELQGTMGMHYAVLSGEPEPVAKAVAEHYAPRFAGDEPATGIEGALVAVADKLDTMAACFGLGLIPSGSQDPYALRRSALGIVATLDKHALSVPLGRLVALSLDGLAGSITRPAADVAPEMEDFLLQRARFLFGERGIRYDVVDAVLGSAVRTLPGLTARAAVLQDKLDSPELVRVLTPYTRAANLTKNVAGGSVDPSLFETDAENELFRAVEEANGTVAKAVAGGDFVAVFNALSPLYQPIDRFFTDVMVMADNEAVKMNRLALLYHVKTLFLTLGDLSKIVQEKK